MGVVIALGLIIVLCIIRFFILLTQSFKDIEVIKEKVTGIEEMLKGLNK